MPNIDDEYFRSAKKGPCCLCGRTADLARHHLQPGKNLLYRGDERVWVCYDCHKKVHYLFRNRDLRKEMNTLEKLRQDPRIIEYVQYIRKRKIKKIHS